MKAQDLGVNIDQTLVLRGPRLTDSTYTGRLNTFKEDLLQRSAIHQITASTAIPGRNPNWNAGGIRRAGMDARAGNQYSILGIDYAFIEMFEVDLLAGRNFSKTFGSDPSAVLVNASAARLLGFAGPEESLNQNILFEGTIYTIIGVVDDYHQESLKEIVDPLIFRLFPSSAGYYAMKIETADLDETIAMIQRRWETLFPGNPFEYFFLDEYFDQQYRADQRFGAIFGLFALVAIMVACLGLFGLTSLMTAQRTKEIGVRKVLGASVRDILVLLSTDITRLVGIAFVVGTPIAYYAMSLWLQDFPYRIDLSVWTFLGAGIVTLVITWLTVGYQALKAALTNPIDTLLYE